MASETKIETAQSLTDGICNGTIHLTKTAVSSKDCPATWHYPKELDSDLEGVDLSRDVIDETIACAWEYTRCIVPTYTNWSRYLAFVRIVIVGIVAEFRGDLVDVSATDDVLGYHIQALVDGCFAGTAGHAVLGREYRAYLLFTGDKASAARRRGLLFRRYVDSLARSPAEWFRLRDCDALVRLTAAAALACNDADAVWFREPQWAVLAEVAAVLYDAVAFYKHRAEAETNSTFAYFPADLRADYFGRCRGLLWRLDAVWAHSRPHLCVVNFVRYFGGPIKMTMRRYRFAEEGLTVGRPETEDVVEQTRRNVKLWNRLDAGKGGESEDVDRYERVLDGQEKLLFPGQAETLRRGESEASCGKCVRRSSYGTQTLGQFGGVQLCGTCQGKWRGYADGVVARAEAAFPELLARHGGEGRRRKAPTEGEDLGSETKRRKT